MKKKYIKPKIEGVFNAKGTNDCITGNSPPGGGCGKGDAAGECIRGGTAGACGFGDGAQTCATGLEVPD